MLIETYNNYGIRYSGFNNNIPLTWSRRDDLEGPEGLLWWEKDSDVLYYKHQVSERTNKKLSKLPRLKKIFVS